MRFCFVLSSSSASFFLPPPNLEGLLSNVGMTKKPYQSLFLSPRLPLAMAVALELPPAGRTGTASRGELGAGCVGSPGLQGPY